MLAPQSGQTRLRIAEMKLMLVFLATADSDNGSVAVSSTRNQVLDGEVKFVKVTGAGFNARDGSSELSILGIVGIGTHVNRRNHVNWEVDGLAPGRRVSDV